MECAPSYGIWVCCTTAFSGPFCYMIKPTSMQERSQLLSFMSLSILLCTLLAKFDKRGVILFAVFE